MNKIKKHKENSDTNIKKRVSLTSAQKKELCEKKCNDPNLKGVNLAKEYRISEQSVSDILKCSEYWLGLDDASTLIQAQYQCILCQNHLEAYDVITEDNPVPPDGRAGILPSMENLDNNFTSMHKETESEASLSEEAKLEAEIINLIECLPIDDPLDVQEYIEVNNYMNIEEDLTINKIIDIVNGQDESKSEKEQEEIVKI
ncbi:5987_t:CDS:2, partial [Cetraspora pellucida]